MPDNKHSSDQVAKALLRELEHLPMSKPAHESQQEIVIKFFRQFNFNLDVNGQNASVENIAPIEK